MANRKRTNSGLQNTAQKPLKTTTGTPQKHRG
jgi:hypothetical protein